VGEGARDQLAATVECVGGGKDIRASVADASLPASARVIRNTPWARRYRLRADGGRISRVSNPPSNSRVIANPVFISE